VSTPIQYAIPETEVVHETIAGEAVIFHLQTGIYYSLTGTGAELWQAVVDGCTVEEMTDRLAARYDAPRDDLEVAAVKLLASLEDEGLVQAGSGTGQPVAPPTSVGTRAAFEAPELKKFDDMQDLLLIDPIHDVEESQGWPTKKASA
jgi:hypothetical protein